MTGKCLKNRVVKGTVGILLVEACPVVTGASWILTSTAPFCDKRDV